MTIALTTRWKCVAKAMPANFGIHVLVQVRLHILLQLDGLAEWMPAMAEQVSTILPLSFLQGQGKAFGGRRTLLPVYCYC